MYIDQIHETTSLTVGFACTIFAKRLIGEIARVGNIGPIAIQIVTDLEEGRVPHFVDGRRAAQT